MMNEKTFEIIHEVLANKHAVHSVKTRKKLSLKKKYSDLVDTVEKVSVFYIQFIEYEEIETIKEGHESGEISKRITPTSMEEINEICCYNPTKDAYYLSGAPVENNSDSVHETEFIVDGTPFDLGDEVAEGVLLKDILYANDYKSKKPSKWIYLNVENIEWAVPV